MKCNPNQSESGVVCIAVHPEENLRECERN